MFYVRVQPSSQARWISMPVDPSSAHPTHSSAALCAYGMRMNTSADSFHKFSYPGLGPTPSGRIDIVSGLHRSHSLGLLIAVYECCVTGRLRRITTTRSSKTYLFSSTVTAPSPSVMGLQVGKSAPRATRDTLLYREIPFFSAYI